LPYITVPQTAGTHQVTLDDIITGRLWDTLPPVRNINSSNTVTFLVTRQETIEKHLRHYNINQLIGILEAFNDAHRDLFDKDRKELYHTFYIPKRTRGFRKIDQPLPELMEALRQLKAIFEDSFGASHHTSAFAYVKGRCTIDAVKRHQMNKSHWFLKTDFSDFFGSTSEDFAFKMISQIFPFSEVVKTSRGITALQTALNMCFLNGGLPQGTPISPALTNLVFLPVDHMICNELIKQGFVYTRYADDILISHRETFDPNEICIEIKRILARFEAPYVIKPEKTRYGSNAGRNWNLGVMLNKDNEITIGRKNKEFLKAACNSYINDKRKKVQWELHDVLVLVGKISYFKMVEPQYVEGFIKWFNEKNNVNLMKLLREETR